MAFYVLINHSSTRVNDFIVGISKQQSPFFSRLLDMPTFSLFDALLILGGTQGLFLALLLQRRKVANKSAANYLLLLVVLVSFLLFAKLSYRSEWLYNYAEVILLPDVILFILGPCLWLFARHLLRLPPLPRSKQWLHALPGLLHILVVNTLLGQHLNGHWSFMDNRAIYRSFLFIEGSAMISLTAYLVASLRLSQKALRAGQFMGNKTASQFLPVFYSVGIVLAVSWAISFGYRVFVYDPSYLLYQVFWFLAVLYVFWLAYTVTLQTTLFDLPPSSVDKTLTSAEETILAHVLQYLEEEKPFLEPQLKLADLATATALPRHELSRIINTGTGQNFFDLINALRVTTFIQAYTTAAEHEKSILQLAYQSGFNSKSAFNRSFRKVTGYSPSEYFKEVSV